MPAPTPGVSTLSRMFSASVFRDLTNRGKSPLLGRLLNATELDLTSTTLTVRDAFDEAFSVLKISGNRDDHVYRSAIIQKLLLGKHSTRTATALFEARASTSRADVVILNGTSTAYEIKSDRDSFSRLHDQLQNYRQLWATVNVVTSPRRADDALALAPFDVGVLVLSEKFTLQTVRAAADSPSRVSPEILLGTLRNSEAIAVLDRLHVETPPMPNTALRQYLTREFRKLPAKQAHKAAVETLKLSRPQTATPDILAPLPVYLRARALEHKLPDTSYAKLHSALGTSLREARRWS